MSESPLSRIARLREQGRSPVTNLRGRGSASRGTALQLVSELEKHAPTELALRVKFFEGLNKVLAALK